MTEFIEVTKCTKEHWRFVADLRADPRCRDGFLEQVESITDEQQDAYMGRHADSYRIGLVNGVPAGYAGSVDGDIRVAVSPDFRGRGVGSALIKEIVRLWPDSHARVREFNKASMALFLRCGFRVHGGVKDEGSGEQLWLMFLEEGESGS